MKLSKEEQKLIEKHRQESLNTKAYRSAKLKHNLYKYSNLAPNGYQLHNYIEDTWAELTFKEVEKLKKQFATNFELVLPKGAICVSYLDRDSDTNITEVWYDEENGYIESLADPEWVKKHLESFKVLRKLSSAEQKYFLSEGNKHV